jgi:DTW domain-containing protein YfiP
VDRCAICLLRIERCLCALIPRIANRTRIVILRHPAERPKTGNTGRIAALALENVRLIEYGEDVLSAAEDALLLYPDGDRGLQAERPPSELIVLDGSWSQARHMLQRTPSLRSIPRCALSPPAIPQAKRIRRAPGPDRVSTIEAIARALDRLHEPSASVALDRLYADMAERLRAAPA